MEITIDILLNLVMAIVFIAMIIYSGRVLKDEHGKDIQIVCYFFSLTFVISFLIGMWFTSEGLIDGNGEFRGEAGRLLLDIITAALDISLSFKFIGSVFALVLAPQFLSYLLSGGFGVGKTPILVDTMISFLIWGTVKTFIVASGVATVILMFGTYYSWTIFKINEIIIFALISLIFSGTAFFTLLGYRESSLFIELLKEKSYLNWFIKIHEWLTRHLDELE